jgi:hypothetical protein
MKSDFVRIEKQLERHHPVDEKTVGGPGAAIRTGLAVSLLPTSLQGDHLLSQSGAVVDKQIVKFLIDNVARLQLPWSNRRSRLP